MSKQTTKKMTPEESLEYQIEEILNKYTNEDVDTNDVDNWHKLIEELTKLIEEEKENAVRGFVEYFIEQWDFSYSTSSKDLEGKAEQYLNSIKEDK